MSLHKRGAGHKIFKASESQEQQTLFEWATIMEYKHPELRLMYHIPNGGQRFITTAKRLKAEGVKAGVPDICLPAPKGIYNGLYIELKAIGGKTSKSQNFWIEELCKQKYKACVCYGWHEASETILKYLEKGK